MAPKLDLGPQVILSSWDLKVWDPQVLWLLPRVASSESLDIQPAKRLRPASLTPETPSKGSGCSPLSDTPAAHLTHRLHVMCYGPSGTMAERPLSSQVSAFREVTGQLKLSGTGTLTAKLWEHQERTLTQCRAIWESFWDEAASGGLSKKRQYSVDSRDRPGSESHFLAF